MNAIEQLRFELAYFKITAQHFSYYAMGTFLIDNIATVMLKVGSC